MNFKEERIPGFKKEVCRNLRRKWEEWMSVIRVSEEVNNKTNSRKIKFKQENN